MADSQPSPHQEFLFQYLQQKGDQFHCYFTIEEPGLLLDKMGNKALIYYEQFQVPNTRVQTKKELMSKLHGDMPDADIFQDLKNTNIVHIISRKTRLTPNYALDQRLDLSFDGTTLGLTRAIGSKLNNTIKPEGIATTLSTEADYFTQVSVNAHNLTIRDILTTSLPLAGYNRILWAADPETNPDGTLTLYIRFVGPAPVSNKSK